MLPTSSEDTEIIEIKKKGEISFPEVIRSEVNFLVFPFFTLWDKDVYQRTKTEYKAIVKRGNEKIEILWKVAANPEYGYPGPFDREVHKAIEQIIDNLPRPIQNPIRLGSLYNLARKMGLKSYKGSEIYREIKEALERITFTGILSKGAFYHKKEEQWIEDAFHLYDRVVFKGKKLPNGEKANTNYLFLNSWYLDNINFRYVKPVDYNYCRFLELPIARRLYELLSIKFYGLGRKENFIRYRYLTLCSLLPITQQKYLSDAKIVLDPAHQKLKETEFLADYAWEDIIPLTQPARKVKDWYIYYYPGKKAKEEIKKIRTYQVEVKSEEQESEPLPLPETKSQEQQKTKPKAALTQSQQKLIDKLENFGVSRIVAEELVRQFELQTIERWMKVIQYKNDIEDKAAYLVKAIRENWQLPESFLREEEVRKEKERRREILRKMEAKQAKKKKTKLISSSPEYEEIWQKVQSLLKQQVSPANFETWIKETALLGIKEGIAFIGVPSGFVKNWLSKRLKALIAKTLDQVLGQEVDLEFVVKKKEE